MPTSTQRFRLVGEDDASRAFLQVAAAAKLLKSNMDDVGTSVLGLTKMIGGGSLIPVAAASTAAVTELGTALLGAGGAAGVFGLSAAGFVKGMITQQKSIATTRQSLTALTKGTTAYHDAVVKLHMKQTAFNHDYGIAAKGFAQMKLAYADFEKQTGQVTKGVMAKGFQLVADVLPKLVPVSNAAGKAIGGLIGDLSHWTEGPSFAHLLHFLETSGPKDITAFGHSIGNVLGGLGGILSNFVGPGDHAAKTLERLTARFDKWGHSKGVSTSVNNFLKYVSDNGPKIDSAFSSLATAAPKIATALGHIGSANLTLTSKFLSLVAGLPQKQFNLIADGLFAIAAGSKAIAIVNGLGGAAGALGALAKGGKGILGKSIGGAAGGLGVQKVYVVNMGPGGMGGGGGGPEGIVGKSAGFLEKHPIIGTTLGTAGLAAVVSLTAYSAYKVWKMESAPGRAPNVAGMSPAQTKSFNNDRMAQMYGANWNGVVKSVGTHLDAMKAKAAKASQQIEQIGPHAANMGRSVVRTITALNGRGTGLDAVKAHAAQASNEIEKIGPNAQATASTAVSAISRLNSQLDRIHDRKFKITADTSQAMANLSVMRYALDALHNKTIIVRAIGGHVPGEPSSSGAGGSSGGGASSGSSSRSMGSGAGTGGAPRTPQWPALLASIVHGVGSHWMPLGTVTGAVRSSLQAARQRLQQTRSTRNQYAAGFQSFATSAFGADYGTDVNGVPNAPTIGDILSHQMGQRDQAAMVKTDVRRLVKLGLSPALLKQLQSAGAAGIPTIQALAGASKAQIAQYNSLNKQTTSDLRAAGMSAGNRIWGQQIRQQAHHEQEVERLLKRLVHLNQHGQKVEVTLNGHHVDTELAKTRKKQGGHLQSDKPKT